MTPPTQAVTPFLHWPVARPQAAPRLGTPSSIWPSQSLSMPSQISWLGPVPPVQVPLQGKRPLVHWLLGKPSSLYFRPGIGVQGVAGMPSSTVPLQLLSRPSQISLCGLLLQLPKPLGCPAPTQPPTGTATPLLWHTRTPWQLAGGLKPQGMSATPSSAMPLQLLSQPSQISALGVQPPGQAL
ncbi:MAG: hypothetical protein R3B13_09595 [Polyangiaceae bacterium]